MVDGCVASQQLLCGPKENDVSLASESQKKT